MDERLKKYIDQAPAIEGGVEAPIQIMVLVVLTIKGFYDLPWSPTNPQNTVKLGYNTLSLPWLPMFSFAISTLSILRSSVVMNALSMYPGKSCLDLIGGHLPFSISAVSFRVLATSFFLVYLGKMAAVPLVILFVSNLVIWYIFAPSIQLPESLEQYLKPESCIEDEDTGLRINNPVWINSIFGIVMPTCTLDIINTKAFDKNERDELTESLQNYHKKYQRKILRLTILTSSLVILLGVAAIGYLVNFTSYSYHPNRLSNKEFNILLSVIMSMGLIQMTFCININVYETLAICKNNNEATEFMNKMKTSMKAMMTIALILTFISPAIIGYSYSFNQAQDPIYLVVNNVGIDGAINITTIVTKQYYIPTTNMTNYQDWGQSITCNEQNAEAYFDPTSALVKDGRNLIFGLGNTANNCYQQLLNTGAEKIKSLKYQSIIMLEDKDFEFRTSSSINFIMKPNFPIVSVR